MQEPSPVPSATSTTSSSSAASSSYVGNHRNHSNNKNPANNSSTATTSSSSNNAPNKGEQSPSSSGVDYSPQPPSLPTSTSTSSSPYQLNLPNGGVSSINANNNKHRLPHSQQQLHDQRSKRSNFSISSILNEQQGPLSSSMSSSPSIPNSSRSSSASSLFLLNNNHPQRYQQHVQHYQQLQHRLMQQQQQQQHYLRALHQHHQQQQQMRYCSDYDNGYYYGGPRYINHEANAYYHYYNTFRNPTQPPFVNHPVPQPPQPIVPVNFMNVTSTNIGHQFQDIARNANEVGLYDPTKMMRFLMGSRQLWLPEHNMLPTMIDNPQQSNLTRTKKSPSKSKLQQKQQLQQETLRGNGTVSTASKPDFMLCDALKSEVTFQQPPSHLSTTNSPTATTPSTDGLIFFQYQHQQQQKRILEQDDSSKDSCDQPPVDAKVEKTTTETTKVGNEKSQHESSSRHSEESQKDDKHSKQRLQRMQRQRRRQVVHRSVFTERQRSWLERAFDLGMYIGRSDRKKLADGLGMQESQVKIWFQNRRMKWRQFQQAPSSTDGNNNNNKDNMATDGEMQLRMAGD